MKLTDKISYLNGLVDGMDLDMTTKEGKVLAQIMEVLPQSQYAARVTDARKHDFDKDEEIVSAIHSLEKKYEGRGRVLVRASGTEPFVRIMIEGPDQQEMDQDVYTLAKLIERKLNA